MAADYENGDGGGDGYGNGNGNGFLHEGIASEEAEARLADVKSLPAIADDGSKAVEQIGVNTLLNRLKQSIASARDFAGFLKERSSLEEKHAQGLKKLCKSTHESARRPDSRQGSYVAQLDNVTRVHERMADNGVQFALSLHQMHEDLSDLANNVERGRKHWKQTGLNAEKRAQDAESTMEKAKSKYDSLAEDYDRARTGDKGSGRVFGLKGPKSAAQHEEELLKKVQAADADYSGKVQTALTLRQELLNSSRPQAIRALQDLITECDSALTLQLQKFAAFNEKLLLGNGVLVSPIKKESDVPEQQSLRDMVSSIDNEKDLQNYITSFTPKVPARSKTIKYERHPTLVPVNQTPATVQGPRQPKPQESPLPQPAFVSGQQSFSSSSRHSHVLSYQQQQPYQPQPPPQQQVQERGYPVAMPSHTQYAPQPPQPHSLYTGPAYSPTLPQPPPNHTQQPLPATSYPRDQHLPPLKPVFGVALEELFVRDGSAVPMVVYQCTQAVDLFGLDVEGIYRLSGTASHIGLLKGMFDNDSSKVDFRNPENFYHDVNSVAGLLKQFFRDLPDPLLTREHYDAFIESARIEDPDVRRDALHAVINALPDPNYATLRALVLHLHRVQEHAHANRMSTSNLAICFAPTLMGAHNGPHIADAGLQTRVVDTVLANALQIFDED
ncbi:hypothetical protein B0A49_02927 [Cryomyces minteri]|uniref:Rho-GAP domain-containing protein n=1 Tax=Cryomyces minteri TaxID=331657 RepID=A0A4U0XIM5_9PEZI|nr:hypothetical protein B0A49_02927 [Cryomyces minteri]